MPWSTTGLGCSMDRTGAPSWTSVECTAPSDVSSKVEASWMPLRGSRSEEANCKAEGSVRVRE
ncbi:hypothetical protein EYF80_013483 [Liparis tanakae]|uniref:Uncharacterized protein n=1 Tax=Liparis tanakae TaxID=230148 RepID=A0A4Z2IF16_9TELE|nr:hypothetical protein EYF80_013483 [Liparis tanakae]